MKPSSVSDEDQWESLLFPSQGLARAKMSYVLIGLKLKGLMLWMASNDGHGGFVQTPKGGPDWLGSEALVMACYYVAVGM